MRGKRMEVRGLHADFRQRGDAISSFLTVGDDCQEPLDGCSSRGVRRRRVL